MFCKFCKSTFDKGTSYCPFCMSRNIIDIEYYLEEAHRAYKDKRYEDAVKHCKTILATGYYDDDICLIGAKIEEEGLYRRKNHYAAYDFAKEGYSNECKKVARRNKRIIDKNEAIIYANQAIIIHDYIFSGVANSDDFAQQFYIPHEAFPQRCKRLTPVIYEHLRKADELNNSEPAIYELKAYLCQSDIFAEGVDIEKSLQHFRISSLLGNGIASNALAHRYSFVDKKYGNYLYSLHYAKIALEQGMEDSRKLYNRLLADELNYEDDIKSHLKSFQAKACFDKNDPAAFRLAMDAYNANYDNFLAIEIIMWCYYNGLGVTANNTKAYEWAELGGELDNPSCLYCLGWARQYGKGTYQDDDEAFDFYERAADLGDINALATLGYEYIYNDKYRNYAKAFDYARKAANRGSSKGMHYLADCYYYGCGTKKDADLAIFWYEQAAERGYSMAQYMMGIMYKNGEAVNQDNKEACYWFKLAADQGHKSASEWYNHLK